MNKWLFAWSCWLLAYLFAVPFRVEAMPIGQLTESCSEPAETILHKGFREVTSDRFKERHIRVFALIAPSPAGAYFAVDISNTDATDAEIPHFKHICYQNIDKPPSMSASGDITLYSPANTAVPLRFRLDKQATSKRPFHHTSWKTSQTLWMRVVPCGASPVVLNPGEWPAGYPVPNVNDPIVEIVMQALPTGGRVCYQYALHMDLADNLTTVDVGVDPQIINQPE
jgi:hypothetical protein